MPEPVCKNRNFPPFPFYMPAMQVGIYITRRAVYKSTVLYKSCKGPWIPYRFTNHKAGITRTAARRTSAPAKKRNVEEQTGLRPFIKKRMDLIYNKRWCARGGPPKSGGGLPA